MEGEFLPVCREDMEQRGIARFDFVYIIGDAYVDHPSFGHAIISRLLEAHGYSVGIISQPDWKEKGSIAIYGEPLHGFQTPPGTGCIYPRGSPGETAGLCYRCLWEFNPPDL